MKRFILLLLLLMATTVYAATTSSNGYFYLPDVGDTGSSIHNAWVAVQEATDAVIGLNVDHRTSGTQTHTNLVNTGYLEVGGSTGMRASGEEGVGTFSSIGQDNNENIKIDLTQPNAIILSSDSDASGLRVSGMGFTTNAVTADPCGTYGIGAVFYNSAKNVLCFCDGTNDLEVHDNSACF